MDPHTRRLAAVLVTDVVGYSAMMAADEEGTLSALQAHRNATDPIILNHGGRIVKSTGDGILVEFATATAAVAAAVEVQDTMERRNQGLPDSRRMRLRLGINLSEVIVDEDGDIFGDGVNIASRVEQLAEAGGTSVTNAVYEALSDRTQSEFADLGDHEVKNIPRPIHIWAIGGPAVATPTHSPTSPVRILATIAVLPFDNMSGDAEQEYFADGITEDLLTALSYDEHLAVVARNSTFAYKGTANDVRAIARELDATHVIEGSVRKSGDRIRVTAQLIDAESGHHVWAERYDRDLEDIFDVQDELVEAITAKLTPTLWDAAGRRRESGDMSSFDAWDLTIRGRYETNRNSVEGYLAGIEFFNKARLRKPDSATAIGSSAVAWFFLAFSGWRSEDTNPWRRATEDADAAYAIASDNYQAIGAKAYAVSFRGDLVEGERLARRMTEINPHGPSGFHILGALLAAGGRLDEAIEASTIAWRLARYEPFRYDTASDIGFDHYMLGSYEAALAWGKQSIDLVPDYLQSNILLAATYAQLDRVEDGRRHVDVVLAKRPNFSCAKFRTRLSYQREQDRDVIIGGLLKAGLPE